MPARADAARNVVLAAAALALALLMAEAGAFAILRARAHRTRARPLPEAAASAYRGQPWAAALWREQRLALAYEPHAFGLWRSRPFAGGTIHVDADGVRATPGSVCGGTAPTVLMFGGSTLWGYGSPDWETIPAWFARGLAAAGRPSCVVNLGEDSWRSSHGTMKLLVELRRGRRPQLVVFLSGCNDVFTPFFLTGRADVEWEHLRTAPWLAARARAREGGFGYLDGTNLAALAELAAARLRASRSWPAPPDAGRLAADVVASYRRDLEAVRALARGYGFRAAFAWQPLSLSAGRSLTVEEEEGTRRQMGPSFELARVAVTETVRRLPVHEEEGFHDLSGAFAQESGTMFLDVCHLTPAANRILAARMLDAIR